MMHQLGKAGVGGGGGGGGGGIQQETAVVPWNILPDVKVHVYAVVLTM